MTDPLIEDLVARRMHLGLTQEDLATRLGVKQATVSRWESGQRSIRLSEVRRYALEVGVDLVWSARKIDGGALRGGAVADRLA